MDCISLNGRTPLHIVCNGMKFVGSDQRSAVTAAADDDNASTPSATPESLFYIAKMECAATLVERCKNVNLPDSKGHTPLRLACEKGDLEIVKLLLSSPTIELDQQTADEPSLSTNDVAATTPPGATAVAGVGPAGSTDAPPPPISAPPFIFGRFVLLSTMP